MLNRDKNVRQLQEESYDLLIIGGGITGAGIALDAASRGLKTALLEKHDFAFGTSSRSTKLIHGGLRYLKQLEFGLVKEVGSERAVVHRLAPHLVIPEKMLLPLYDKRGFGSLLTSLGLKLYDWLAGVLLEDKRRMLTRSQTLRQEPLLKPEDVKGGAIYAEYRTDDARLTIEIIKTAAAHGAVVANYAEVSDFIYEESKIRGVQVKDHLTSQAFPVRAKVVVSAAGPWVDQLREINHSKKGKRLHHTKGVHLVVLREKFPVQQAIYFDVADGRMIFAIPRGRITYVGTTDTHYRGSLDEILTSREDAVYLIEAVNRTFPSVNLSMADIESSWAGLRPLIHEEGKSTGELSRKDEIFESPTGLISIAGGKLTGYRKMAERVVDKVLKDTFREKWVDCKTEKIAFQGSDFKNAKQVKEYIGAKRIQLTPYHLEQYASYLVGTYGKQTESIISSMKGRANESQEEAMILSELNFCLENEMVCKPSDFLVRRTGLLYFDRPLLKRVMNKVLTVFKGRFNWNEDQYHTEMEVMKTLVQQATMFK